LLTLLLLRAHIHLPLMIMQLLLLQLLLLLLQLLLAFRAVVHSILYHRCQCVVLGGLVVVPASTHLQGGGPRGGGFDGCGDGVAAAAAAEAHVIDTTSEALVLKPLRLLRS
jgi:hypothetical protein